MRAPTHLADVSASDPQGLVRLVAERPVDAAAVTALVDRAFGPGRYAKVSERLREGNRLNAALSFCAFDDDERLIGTVRQWPVTVGARRCLFLGPIAVEGVFRRHGVGGHLIARCVQAATEAGERFILLVGDLALFGPHGFERVRSGAVMLPGPADPARILVRPLNGADPEDLAGAARVPQFGV